MAEKTPLHRHEHPAYQWLALVVAVGLVLSLAGWYVLTYQTTTEEDALSVVESSFSTTSKTTTATKTDSEIDSVVSGANTDMNSASSADFSEDKLDNTSLGL